MTTTGDGVTTCANCGRQLGAAAHRCIYCGAIRGRQCPKCKAVIPVGAEVCFVCKADIPAGTADFVLETASAGVPTPSVPPPPSTPSRRRFTIGLLLLLLVFLVGGGYLLYSGTLTGGLGTPSTTLPPVLLTTLQPVTVVPTSLPQLPSASTTTTLPISNARVEAALNKTIDLYGPVYPRCYPNAPTDKLSVQYVVIEIGKQAGLRYNWKESYRNTDPICRQWVRPDIRNQTCKDALRQLLDSVGLTYKVEDEQIVLLKK